MSPLSCLPSPALDPALCLTPKNLALVSFETLYDYINLEVRRLDVTQNLLVSLKYQKLRIRHGARGYELIEKLLGRIKDTVRNEDDI